MLMEFSSIFITVPVSLFATILFHGISCIMLDQDRIKIKTTTKIASIIKEFFLKPNNCPKFFSFINIFNITLIIEHLLLNNTGLYQQKSSTCVYCWATVIQPPSPTYFIFGS